MKQSKCSLSHSLIPLDKLNFKIFVKLNALNIQKIAWKSSSYFKVFWVPLYFHIRIYESDRIGVENLFYLFYEFLMESNKNIELG